MSEAVQDPVNKAVEAAASELVERRWAVISFERREGSELSYADAMTLLATLDKRGVPGLCIVADEAAARISA